MNLLLASLAWQNHVKWLAPVSCLLVGVGNLGAVAAATNATASGNWARLPRTNLLVYHGRHGELLPVKSKSDWQKRRTEIVRGFEQIAGPWPGPGKRCALDVRLEEKIDCGDYERQLLTYASEPGSRVPAYLLVPKAVLASHTPASAVLCLHPTDLEYGHRVTVEKLRDYYPAAAAELAARGFVILAPAYPLMANYQPDLKLLGWESGTLKAVWDNLRGLDLLDSLSFVRPGKYGVIGHSLGGHNAIYTAVFDQRIKVIVSSCGFDSYLDYYDGNPQNWQPQRGWCQPRYLPKLAEYGGRLAEIPFDFHELLGALAPRAVFINAPLNDSNFRARSVDEIVNAAAAVYRLYGAESNLTVEHPVAGHEFPAAVRGRAYDLLAAKLH